jgi:hypothetical protein
MPQELVLSYNILPYFRERRQLALFSGCSPFHKSNGALIMKR